MISRKFAVFNMVTIKRDRQYVLKFQSDIQINPSPQIAPSVVLKNYIKKNSWLFVLFVKRKIGIDFIKKSNIIANTTYPKEN